MINGRPRYSEINNWRTLQDATQVDDSTLLTEDDYYRSDSREADYLHKVMSLSPSDISLFIVDIFIETACPHGFERKLPTSPRRCLIDTGSDLNIITYRALQGVLCDVEPFSGHLYGAGGSTCVIARTNLSWHFKRGCDPLRRRRLGRLDPFVVVDPATPYNFDCVLGRPWIQEHMLLFQWICLKQNLLAAYTGRTQSLRNSVTKLLNFRAMMPQSTVRVQHKTLSTGDIGTTLFDDMSQSKGLQPMCSLH